MMKTNLKNLEKTLVEFVQENLHTNKNLYVNYISEDEVEYGWTTEEGVFSPNGLIEANGLEMAMEPDFLSLMIVESLAEVIPEEVFEKMC